MDDIGCFDLILPSCLKHPASITFDEFRVALALVSCCAFQNSKVMAHQTVAGLRPSIKIKWLLQRMYNSRECNGEVALHLFYLSPAMRLEHKFRAMKVVVYLSRCDARMISTFLTVVQQYICRDVVPG